MGLFSGLFGGNSNSVCDVETEYRGLLDSVECLARVGAEYGQYQGFFMMVKCQKDQVIIVLKVEFGDHLKWLQRNPDCLAPSLQRKGITQSEFEFLMNNIRIKSEDERHDIGEAQISDRLKSPKHSKAVYEALKSRLLNIKHTTHSTDEKSGEYTIFLHDE